MTLVRLFTFWNRPFLEAKLDPCFGWSKKRNEYWEVSWVLQRYLKRNLNDLWMISYIRRLTDLHSSPDSNLYGSPVFIAWYFFSTRPNSLLLSFYLQDWFDFRPKNRGGGGLSVIRIGSLSWSCCFVLAKKSTLICSMYGICTEICVITRI